VTSMFATISIVVDPSILDRFDRIAASRNTSRSALVRALMENLVNSETVQCIPTGGYTEPPPVPIGPAKSFAPEITPGCNAGLVKLPDGTLITLDEYRSRGNRGGPGGDGYIRPPCRLGLLGRDGKCDKRDGGGKRACPQAQRVLVDKQLSEGPCPWVPVGSMPKELQVIAYLRDGVEPPVDDDDDDVFDAAAFDAGLDAEDRGGDE